MIHEVSLKLVSHWDLPTETSVIPVIWVGVGGHGFPPQPSVARRHRSCF